VNATTNDEVQMAKGVSGGKGSGSGGGKGSSGGTKIKGPGGLPSKKPGKKSGSGRTDMGPKPKP
jgi:hypothetical protein